MFCTGAAPTVPGISARFSSPGQPCASVQPTKSCQFSPAPASTIQARSVSSTRRRPAISTFSTSERTSPVSTMLLPPPRMNFGCDARRASSSTARRSSSAVTRTSAWARATMPKLLYGWSGTFFSTNIGSFSHWGHPPATQEPAMPSFDAVCEPNLVELRNAVDNASKEIATRFDFKGTSAAIELKDKDVTLLGDAEFQLQQIEDILRGKRVKNGIDAEQAKKITRLIKDSKLKLQASIQGDAVRISGAKRDDLQAAMALIKKEIADLPVTFDNLRD